MTSNFVVEKGPELICSKCGRLLVVGYDRYYQVGVVFEDPFHKSIWLDEPHHVAICLDCGEEPACVLAKALIRTMQQLAQEGG